MKRNWCWTYFLFYILLIWGCVRTQRTPCLMAWSATRGLLLSSIKNLAIPCVCDATVGRRVSHVGMEQRTRQHPISILTERFHIASVIRVTSPAGVTTRRVAVLRKKTEPQLKLQLKGFLTVFGIVFNEENYIWKVANVGTWPSLIRSTTATTTITTTTATTTTSTRPNTAIFC